ncbi:MAG: hypothetical protein AAF708_00440 [Deinococcota bacterium]
MPKGKSNKYAGLIDAVEDTSAPESQDTQVSPLQDTEVQKSRIQLMREGKMKQLKALIPTELHLKTRIAVLEQNTDLSELVETLLEEWHERLEAQK